MTGLQIALSFVIIIVAVIIIALVLLQESKQQGLGAITGAAESFFGKNKDKTLEAKLSKLTKIFGTIFFVLAFVSSMIVLFNS